jgi:hypothetical protein
MYRAHTSDCKNVGHDTVRREGDVAAQSRRYRGGDHRTPPATAACGAPGGPYQGEPKQRRPKRMATKSKTAP